MYEEIRGELSEQVIGVAVMPCIWLDIDFKCVLCGCVMSLTLGIYWVEVILSAGISNMTGCIVLMCTSGFDQPLR